MMAVLARILVPPVGARASFCIAAVVAFVSAMAGLLLMPLGDAPGEPTRGEEVRAELIDGATVVIEPELRDQGWRATWRSEPYALDLQVTVVNDGEYLFPRWYDVRVSELSDPEKPFILRERRSNDLGAPHVPAGESVTTEFTFDYPHACGDFVAYVEYSFDFEYGTDQRTVEAPFTVESKGCSVAGVAETSR